MNIGIILGAGDGFRLQAGTKKAFVDMFGRPLVWYSLLAFVEADSIDEIIVVLPPISDKAFKELFDSVAHMTPKEKGVIQITGGGTRFESLKEAYKALHQYYTPAQLKNANIIIHNVANPMISLHEINDVAGMLERYSAAGVAIPVYDTVRRINVKKTETISRDNLWRMQTPQGLRYKVLEQGLKEIKHEPTDDLELAEIQGIKPKIIPCTQYNFKITTDSDLALAEDIMMSKKELTFGFGEDSHAFDTKGRLNLGGVEFKRYKKLQADSDGDVAIHALVTAILQAFNMGSLGEFVKPLYARGIKDSKLYLVEAMKIVTEGNWAIEKIDFMIEGSKPKIDPIRRHMVKAISIITGASIETISIAAHTGDGLTPFGRGEGIRCQCLIMMERIWLP
ncbi:MAG: hypothetical protein ACD_65C00066G0002 [uncultured bacterium]|nr:MAG: hypothetical protein ACD_65C00066G0002 [uncultured bacterium]KKT01967.1 MAG: 2-C-methyl-D-erythritol 4-phosphate cytidylyltransferase/ 2C-methyl-D-erythritol 2,4-cyclodiphosphate synthase [Candidatus Peregrinibacteria bacterium GW2011_GWF2_43_17]KKT19216.1 MAG: 2-C-methyl-D-erythritol 4-phosphate cytidylyltransferase/ 2C-methyl-D-erythritol 2,4-cyclodiphosphate synthase [Candidatus Peregrinibacteria bacterium GW2011_GWA2_43_8]HAU39623.1 2-C-methyl-D-erythritol 2,4-cyclodiphosphate syntha